MNIPELVSKTERFRRMAFEAYGHGSLAQLEILRAMCEDPNDRMAIDWVIAERKRMIKAQLEEVERQADAFGLAAVPAALALPALLGALISGQLVSADSRPYWVLASIVLGAAAWAFCRLRAFQLSRDAKVAAVKLGIAE